MTLWPPESQPSCGRIKVLLISHSLSVRVTAHVIARGIDTGIAAFRLDIQLDSVGMWLLTRNSICVVYGSVQTLIKCRYLVACLVQTQ